MKILALGDPHGKLPKNLDGIVKKEKPDVIVCIGEVFPIQRHADGSGDASFKIGEKIINKIASYRIPAIIFKGNMFNIRGKSFFIKILKKYEIGYRETGTFNVKDKEFVIFDMVFEHWAYKHLDSKFIKKVSASNPKREKILDKLLTQNKGAILLSHAPPYNCLDKVTSGKHVGSKILRRAIEKHQPPLVLCGHIHEAKGKARIGKTKVINLGCCGDYEVIEIR